MENKYNVCRPFVFYNDFIPPESNVHEDWQYLAFGYYDGISVGDNLFVNGKIDMNALWRFSVEHSVSLKGQCLSQIVFGLRGDVDDSQEEEFWAASERERFPFLFISLLQMKNTGGIRNDEIIRGREKLEKNLGNQNQNCKTRTYLTLDNSDLILVLMCGSYSEGVELIDCLHRGKEPFDESEWTLSYSYTTAALHKKILNSDVDLGNEVIHSVYIYAIEKFPGSIDYVYNKLNEKTGGVYLKSEKQSTLGCNDELMTLENIPWSVFRELYKDKIGILNHSCAFYQRYLLGVTTIIGKNTQRDDQKTDQNENSNETLSHKTLSHILMRRFEKIAEQSENKIRLSGFLKNIYQILNSLQRFETTSFPDYMFRSILIPLNMVPDLMEKAFREGKENDLFESVHSLFKGINLYAQNSIKSDRQFTQSLDFNIKLYHTPVKLNAFYNAYLYNLKSYLGGMDSAFEKHEYEFIACPGMTDNMQVQELFSSLSETKKTYLVSIPEKQMYDMSTMMVMLGHEVGHFVGREIRSRENRSKIMIKILAHITARYLRQRLNHAPENLSKCSLSERYWDLLEERLEYKMELFLEKYNDSQYLREKFIGIDDEGIQEWINNLKKYEYYSRVLNYLLPDCVMEVLQERDTNLFLFPLEEMYDQVLGGAGEDAASAAKDKLSQYIVESIRDWASTSPWNSRMQNLSAVTELIVEYVKECAADLIIIMTLKLHMSDYLKTLVQCAKDQDQKEGLADKTLLRAMLVTRCMCEKPDHRNAWYWKDEEIKKIEDSKENDLMKIKDKILWCMEELFETSTKVLYPYDEQVGETAFDFMWDSDVLTWIAEYLRGCQNAFNKNNKQEKKQQSLIWIYHQAENMKIDDMVLEIQKYIAEYQDLIEDRIRDLIQQ